MNIVGKIVTDNLIVDIADNLTEKESSSLWDEGVNLNGFEYVLFSEQVNYLNLNEYGNYQPISNEWSSNLFLKHKNLKFKWYNAFFKGKRRMIGVAYN